MMRILLAPLLLITLLGLTGCSSSNRDYREPTSGVSVGYYHRSGWYDPYYRNRCCYNGGVIVRPPAHRPGHRPPQAKPLPTRPRPGTRPAIRR